MQRIGKAGFDRARWLLFLALSATALSLLLLAWLSARRMIARAVRAEENLARLDSIKQLLKVSPGSVVLLRGHVDDAQVSVFREKGGEAYVRQMALRSIIVVPLRSREAILGTMSLVRTSARPPSVSSISPS